MPEFLEVEARGREIEQPEHAAGHIQIYTQTINVLNLLVLQHWVLFQAYIYRDLAGI